MTKIIKQIPKINRIIKPQEVAMCWKFCRGGGGRVGTGQDGHANLVGEQHCVLSFSSSQFPRRLLTGICVAYLRCPDPEHGSFCWCQRRYRGLWLWVTMWSQFYLRHAWAKSKSSWDLMSNLFLDLTYQVLSHGGPIKAGPLLVEPCQGALHGPRKQESLLSYLYPRSWSH